MKNWYELANSQCREIAAQNGVPVFQVAAIMYACSINTTWERNQKCVAEYYQTGKVAHMSKVQAMVDTISECPCPVGLLPLFGGLKTRSFYLNLLNPTPTTKTPPVTIDRWMLRWLTGDNKKPTHKRYDSAVQAIYRVA